MKVIKKICQSTYVAKNGKEYHHINYYLVLDNNRWIAIRPSFGNSYAYLDAISEVVKE